MTNYSSLADDYYVNMILSTEMEFGGSRETILHYFEQMQRKFPEMRNFYARDKGDFVLEEEKDRGSYRWCSVESRRICSGYVNPTSVDEAVDQHAGLRGIALANRLRFFLPRQSGSADRRSARRLPSL